MDFFTLLSPSPKYLRIRLTRAQTPMDDTISRDEVRIDDLFYLFQNMPFSLKNKYAVVLGSALFFSSGLSFPFYVLYIRTKRGN